MKVLSRLFVVPALVLSGALAHASVNMNMSNLGNKTAGNIGQADLAKFGFADVTELENYFTISSTSIRETEPGMTARAAASFYAAQATNPSDVLGSIGAVATDPSSITAWVTLGQRVWQIVVDNRPVVNVATQRVSVLPKSSPDWAQMSNWQGPVARTYVLEARNLYGATVVKHAYTVAFNYGGKLGGKGAFLANATIIPASTDVWWGYNLNSQVNVGQVVNTGSLDNPTPGINLELQYAISTIFKHNEGRDNFFVRGDGSVSHVTLVH